MERNELYDLINLQPEIVQKLKVTEKGINLREIQPYLEQLTDIQTAPKAYDFLEALFQGDEDHLKMLYCQLECACRTYDTYQEKHIPDAIFTDTMKCFPRFIRECQEKNGRMFFDRGWWTYRQISMSLFRIGTLEYEFQAPGESGISVHIPSDADLAPESVKTSLEKAISFFRTFYPDYVYDKYTCDSWLMAPALRTLLPETSNILAFQDLFTITGEGKDSSGCLEWLFRRPGCTDYEKLPAATSLQKKAKELLLTGGYIGYAHGEIPLSAFLASQSVQG